MTKVSKSELKSKLKNAAQKFVSDEAAEYFANETIESYLRKMPRTNPLKSAIGDLEATKKFGPKELINNIDLGSYQSIDFSRQGPLVFIKQVHDELAEKASKNGLAMAAFTNSQSMHTLHSWVQGLAKRGFVAFAACNGGPAAVVPYNGTKGLFGTNPIAYGFPGEDGDIYCVDMATSEIPYFEIMDAYKAKEPLKDRSAVDENGEFTKDAAKALDFSQSEDDPVSNIVPMGAGYKGYYIVYLIELLTSGLIGMPSSSEMSDDFVPEEHGALLLVFSPEAMQSKIKLVQSIKAINKDVKSQEPKDGTTMIVPGDQNSDKFDKLKDEDSIDVDKDLFKKLELI